VVEQLWDALATICREGVKILLVEQDVNLTLSIADGGYVMETGHIVRSGSASKLRTIRKSDAPISGFGTSRKNRRLFDGTSGRETCSVKSPGTG
jgi:ABC-type cobalamin transport system ATPase subunit